MLRQIARPQQLQRCVLGSRLASTAASGEAAASGSAPPPSTPSSSKSSTGQWSRPLARGVNKAYDEALALIQKDSAKKTEELQKRRKALREESEDVKQANAKKLEKLEIESQINVPEVHWNISHGKADMSKPIYRHLLEKSWRKDGRLDLLMERVHQMYVLPDVLPAMHPTVDLHVIFDRKYWKNHLTGFVDVEPGVFMPPRMTIHAPRMQATVFHPEERLYTLLMVDPDVPDTDNKTFQTYVHLLKTNISLSASSSYLQDINVKGGLLPYEPPHPQKGTPYHRYVTLLLPQVERLNLTPADLPSGRAGFDVREFAAKHKLGYYVEGEGVSMEMVPETYKEKVGKGMGGGIHMWRAVWDEDVSRVYTDILKLPEPTYGFPPKPDRYGNLKIPKYI
ncbi:hypothetical protein FS837_005984 [Tulasnella sp. UAMH 9824]|nr:hypothetical protein FS837_005984 [Tulasnella sp. UAMH 9824]